MSAIVETLKMQSSIDTANTGAAEITEQEAIYYPITQRDLDKLNLTS